MTHFMTTALGTPSRMAQILRNTFIARVSRLAPFQHGFVRLSELNIAFGGSPIVEGPGKRFFDNSLRGGNGIGNRFLLIVGQQMDSATQEAAKQLCETSSEIVELRIAPYPGIAFLRPDGYIAYTTDGHDSLAAMTALHSVVTRPIN
jgi:hypothetical protein